MKRTVTGFLLLMLVICLGSAPQSGLRAEIRDYGKYLEESVFTTSLSNGIKVILLNRGYTPTLALNISFKVGSVEESYRTMGVAHLLEHMLFKGTDRIGTRDYKKEKKIMDRIEAIGSTLDILRLRNPRNERIPVLEKKLKALEKEQDQYIINSPYDKIYSSEGGVGLNASTSRDKTEYYVELPASRLELWASLESERLRNPVLRQFYLERDAVLEERLRSYDSNGVSALFEKFIAEAFIAHPYRHPIIGWQSNIRTLSITDVRRFYNSHYIPSRMTITIVGRQDTAKTLKILQKYFGPMERYPGPPDVTVVEPAQKGERRFELKFEANPYLVIGWHKPTSPSRDDYVCDVIAELLAGGRSSRLYKTLVLEKKIASTIGSWNGFPGARYDNLFVITAAPRKGQDLSSLEQGIYDELERLKKDLRQEELDRVLNRMEASFIFDLDSNKGVAGLLSYYQTVLGDWHYVTGYLKILKSVSRQDVREAIDRYLIKDNRTVGYLINIRDSRKPR